MKSNVKTKTKCQTEFLPKQTKEESVKVCTSGGGGSPNKKVLQIPKCSANNLDLPTKVKKKELTTNAVWE